MDWDGDRWVNESRTPTVAPADVLRSLSLGRQPHLSKCCFNPTLASSNAGLVRLHTIPEITHDVVDKLELVLA